MVEDKKPATTDDAIWSMYHRQLSIEQTLRGTPGTAEGGLVKEVQEVKALAIEVKDYYINHEGRLSAQEAKCKERTVVGDCIPEQGGVKGKGLAKASGISGAVGIIIGAVLDWLFRRFTGA